MNRINFNIQIIFKILISISFYTMCNERAMIASDATLSFPEFKEINAELILINTQEEIHNAFIKSIKLNDHSFLLDLKSNFNNKNWEDNSNLLKYWSSYLQYYLSVYYFKIGDAENSKTELDLGIYYLENIKDKDSEDYALLALLQGFSIQFKEGKAIVIIGNIKRNCRKALAIDSTNLRAYFAYASNDYHMPIKFGGGQETEEYLLKAISISHEKNENSPSWGREESFELLIKWYIKNDMTEKANEYYILAKNRFPKSYRLNKLEELF